MKIRAFVENMVYYNEDNYYAVLEVTYGGSLVTMTGYFPFISIGETIEAEGEYTVHPVYGEQFSVESYTVEKPESADMIERYLAAGAVKGIGPGLAERIVKKFKCDTFRIMEEEPERLAEIKGISMSKAREISEQFELKRGYRDAVMYLQNIGIGPNMARKIFLYYGPAVYSVIEKNPYKLADDIDGIGFKLADRIASQMGQPEDSEFRIKSGLLFTLSEGVAQGHTWLPEEVLIRNTAELLSLSEELIRSQLQVLQVEDRIRVILPCEGSEEKTQVYLASCYYVERNIAARLNSLNIRGECDEDFVNKRIKNIAKETGLEPDEKQAEALRSTVTNGVLVITGGPGTGKTTTINSIIRYYEKDHYNIFLAAPTGRAAKRMSEATGCEAKTIHRLLEYTGAPEKDDKKGRTESYGGSGNAGGAGATDGKGRFLRDEKDPLECDVLIVDEMSMVDIFLMEALLKAVVPGTRLILVGDSNQLPSVGAGNVLKDIIRSEQYTTVCLNHIFRQAMESDIVVNAHKINEGEEVDLSKKSKDFLFIGGREPSSIIEYIKTLITKKLPGYVGASVYDIQVLTPTRKGVLGVEILNKVLQEFLNPPEKKKKERRAGEFVLREGDKIMQVKNNYDIEWERLDERGLPMEKGAGVFNGDIGKIIEIDEHRDIVKVLMDDERVIEYGSKEYKELELAYAVTVHKSQGSEYPAVVMPMYPGPSMLMNRNLLYTAVTRAKKCVCLVGEPGVFVRMENNLTENLRYSGLEERIRELQFD